MKSATVRDVDFEKGDGLVPVIAQEQASGKILMLAYANRLALQRTLETGFAHYWSRSREKLWKKGEESGHLQHVHEILLDCDGDTLLYIVNQVGPACHTGEVTCFFRAFK
ncbi:MAG: phosphoribosyl-AMP cyclohydrolase [Candidatus Bathyarchaeia archaeon]|jgi:phosphoribosyl-AMP cyclohydrolase